MDNYLDGSGFITLPAFRILYFVRSQQMYARHAVTRLQVQVTVLSRFSPFADMFVNFVFLLVHAAISFLRIAPHDCDAARIYNVSCRRSFCGLYPSISSSPGNHDRAEPVALHTPSHSRLLWLRLLAFRDCI